MYLKQLTINGFKSFADRTRLSLRPGITAIVGPNGCGKSNIVDAIRWVLGEQSAKALRGGSMHDVIFSGTDKRKPLQFCEVELVFADCEKELGTAFNEVSISRRVSREDSSDYLLNGKSCRLKDIQRLFMDTGVGRVSYSFMVQGQIDQILSANPSERRSLFEEAAGITKYKAQRKEALGKLSLTDQNLARVTDVLEELSRQINSLKRQAAKALRYKREQHRLIHLDLACQAYQSTQLRKEIQTLEQQVNTLREQLNTQKSQLEERERILAAMKVKRSVLTEQLERSQQQIFALRSEKENAESQIQFSQVRTQDLRERIVGIEQEISAINSRKNELENQIQGGGDSKKSHEGELAGADETFKIRQRELDTVLNELNTLERELARERQELLMTENEMTRSRSIVTTIEVDLRTSEIRHAEIGNSLAQMREERYALTARSEEIAANAEMRRAEHALAQQAVELAREEGKKLLAQFREQQQNISNLDRQAARISAQLTMHEQLQAKFEGFSDGAKAILKGELGEIAPAGTAQALNTILSVKENLFAPAIELLLGAATESLYIADQSKLIPILQTLAERKLGKAILSLNYKQKNIPSPELPEGIFAAEKLVETKLPHANQFIEKIFSRCYVADDVETFINFWQKNPEFDFILVATLNGELIDCRGFLHTASCENNGNSSTFRRETEINQLRERLKQENNALTDANQKTLEIQRAIDENEIEIEQRRVQAGTLVAEISAITADERSALKALENNTTAIEKQENLLAEFENARDLAIQKMENAKNLLAENENKITVARESIAQKETAIASLRESAEQHREAVNEVRFALAQKKQELEMIEREVAQIQKQLDELQTRTETREREKDNALAQIEAFTEQAENAKARVEQLSQTLENAGTAIENQRQELRETETQIEISDNSMNGERNELRERESQLNSLEIKLTETNSQANFIAEKVFSEYRLNITDIDWKEKLWKSDEEIETKIRFDELEEDENNEISPKRRERSDPSPEELAAMENTDWQPLRREVEDLRERLLSMGAVNHTAIEEYAELRERYTFLKTQADDLWNSKNELVKAIDEINETSQKLFTETFEQIRKNFKFTFERLFHGGESDLQLIQSEDILDSGIEIIARPPGTKLRSISLLSGGQRTMTAVALLFAIYMVKPSPFCVLDELDAPLDDANVGRFTDIVREFTRYSQFLVVTHNKRTVSAADTIYGVTMQERGVTQLLSMRFNRDIGDMETTGTATESTLGKGGTFSMAR